MTREHVAVAVATAAGEVAVELERARIADDGFEPDFHRKLVIAGIAIGSAIDPRYAPRVLTALDEVGRDPSVVAEIHLVAARIGRAVRGDA